MKAFEKFLLFVLSYDVAMQGISLQPGPGSSPQRLLEYANTGGSLNTGLTFLQPLPHSIPSLSLSPTVQHQRSDLTEKSDLHKCGPKHRHT